MQIKNNYFFLIIIIFIIVTFFLINQPSNLTSNNIKQVRIAGQNVKVDLALTAEDQAQGLSGRRELKADQGMLFVFERNEGHPFWMKDMNFPIDIIWIGSDMKVVYIQKEAKPEEFPNTYGMGKNSKYVLEVVAGFSEESHLKEGDRVEFTY